MKYVDHKDCIDACLQSVFNCEYCAASCLREDDSAIPLLKRCVQLNMECAEACIAAVKMMSIGGVHADDYCRLCAKACEACARECEKHDYDHCRACAAATHLCAKKCRSVMLEYAEVA